MNLPRWASSRWLTWLLLAVMLGGTAFLIAENPKQFEVLRNVELAEIIGLLAVNYLSFFITVAAGWHLLRAVDAAVPLPINLGLAFLANFLNYFAPAQPGMGAKAVYLKLACRVRYTDFAIVSGTNAIVMVWVSGLIGMLVVGWIRISRGVLLTELALVSLAMFVFVVVIVAASPANSPFDAARHPKLAAVFDVLCKGRQLWGRKRVMLTAIGFITLQYLAAGCVVLLCYGIVGVDLGYPLALLITALVSVANIVPLTPNNVGVAELVMGVATELSGADFSAGIVAGSIIRACHIIITLSGLPYAHWRLRRAAMPADSG